MTDPSSQPLVSIGIPTYNRPAGLRRTLERVCAQTWTNLDIIVSDNCSTNPEVAAITAEFAARDGRIRVFRQPENIGLENNFNFTYTQGRGPYFMWMSDDDEFEPGYVEACVRYLESHPDTVLCSGDARYYEGGRYVYREKMFRVGQSTAMARIWRYFSRVHKNGNFYGVFRYGLLRTAPLHRQVGCDWTFMGSLCVLGKLHYLDETAYHRSAEGNSQSRAKMVAKFGLTGWKKLFFETYSAGVIAGQLFRDPGVRTRMSAPLRLLAISMVFFQINAKLLFKFLRKVITGRRDSGVTAGNG
jgi:glycosyltransferase involved in cell wall biosynthesis